ncbi:MAG: hypothetical protein F9K16_08365 [Thermoanaerobaculia bacterium]|jgi:hypothetical protein|nr:MAG: hypothetical protein F9K16_08365 [Thermoanaerobaculia bacterium]MBZ0101215.1 hypothetical protein [Thermoanaerobaculia bacterium]
MNGMTLTAIAVVLVLAAGWWVRRQLERSADRKLRARKSVERQRADDLHDFRKAFESRARATGVPGGEPRPAPPACDKSAR